LHMRQSVAIAALAAAAPDICAQDVIAGNYSSWSIDIVVVLVNAAVV
jgi:hypothetical protein